MTRMPRYLLLLSLVALLAGCAASPKPSKGLFLLQQPHVTNDSPVAADTATQEQPVLVLPEIELAPYLRQDGIIYQTGPNRIVVADNNRWAAPLATQTTAGLHAALDRGLAHVNVRRPGFVSKPDYRLFVYIERFQGRFDGLAVISGNWRLFTNQDELVGRGDFAQKIPLKQDGYAALVRALSRGWHTIKQNIVNAVAGIVGKVTQDKT